MKAIKGRLKAATLLDFSGKFNFSQGNAREV